MCSCRVSDSTLSRACAWLMACALCGCAGQALDGAVATMPATPRASRIGDALPDVQCTPAVLEWGETVSCVPRGLRIAQQLHREGSVTEPEARKALDGFALHHKWR